MTQEEKAKAYDESMNRAKKELGACGSQDCNAARQIFRLFPELKESDDERIRKEILEYFQQFENEELRGVNISDWIAWIEKQGYKDEEILVLKDQIESLHAAIKALKEAHKIELEKQGEQKPTDKVEQKFHEGEWITNSAVNPAQISSIKDGMYFTHNDTIGSDIKSIDKEYHLWTIQDAKDGDVLYTSSTASNKVFIFKELTIEGYIKCYCSYDSEDKYREGKYHFIGKPTFMTHPATKEQRDTLMKAMADAGYTFDFEKKELKKIEQKPAWSEEDESLRRRCIGAIDMANLSDYTKDNLLNWLKSLRPQSHWKPEWGEKDEENLNGIMNFICFHSSLVASGTDEWYEWLKSLKDRVQPHNTWKPSDELLDVFIKNAIDFFGSNFNSLTDGGVIGAFDDKEKMIEEFKEYMKEEGFNEEWI